LVSGRSIKNHDRSDLATLAKLGRILIYDNSLSTKNFKLNGKLINIKPFKIVISKRVYFMPLPDKEDLKCYAFIFVVIVLILLATFYYPFIVRFVLLVVFYWYISIPVIIISLSSTDFAIRRIKIRKAYNSMNSVEYQESFKKLTGENPLKNGKITKTYKNWLIQKITVPKYKIKSKIRFSPDDLKSFIFLIIILIVVIIVFLAVYAVIFPDYLLPVKW